MLSFERFLLVLSLIVFASCAVEVVEEKKPNKSRLLLDRSQMILEIDEEQSLTLLNYGGGVVEVLAISLNSDAFELGLPQELPFEIGRKESKKIEVVAKGRGDSELKVVFVENEAKKTRRVLVSTLRQKAECKSENRCVRAYRNGGECIEELLTGNVCDDGNVNTNDDQCEAGVCVGVGKDYTPGFDTPGNARGAMEEYMKKNRPVKARKSSSEF